jgi:cytochrome c oxidase subunit 2
MGKGLKFTAPAACLLLILAAAIYVVRVRTRALAGNALTVRAVAHEWWWEFDYPSLGIRTSDSLYLPSRTEVELELASADVIHSFWIEGMKAPVDIVPGTVRTVELKVHSPGELYGNCDSGCGCGTVCMRFKVVASPARDFQQWAARERAKPDAYKPPRSMGAPECAVNTGRSGHPRHQSSPATRLQQLLEGSDQRGGSGERG